MRTRHTKPRLDQSAATYNCRTLAMLVFLFSIAACKNKDQDTLNRDSCLNGEGAISFDLGVNYEGRLGPNDQVQAAGFYLKA